MNCKKAKSLMVLSSTLTPAEKSALDEHLVNCPACSASYASIQEQDEVIERVRNWNPDLQDPIAFTDQIINALPSQKIHHEAKNGVFQTFLNWSPLQTSLAVCSLILALTFALEFYQLEEPTQPRRTIKSGVALSSNLEKLIQAKRIRAERFSLEKIIQQENTFALQKN